MAGARGPGGSWCVSHRALLFDPGVATLHGSPTGPPTGSLATLPGPPTGSLTGPLTVWLYRRTLMALQAGLCFNVFYMWAYYTGLLISLFLVYLFLYLFYTVSAYIPFYFI